MKNLALFLVALLVVSCTTVVGGCTKTKAEYYPIYDVVLNYDGERSLDGSMSCEFTNDYADGIDKIRFNLYCNVYQETSSVTPVFKTELEKAYYGGVSYGGITIIKVWDSSGFLNYDQSGNSLEVNLNKKVPLYAKISVYVSFKIVLPYANCRFGVSKRAVNLGNFIPTLCRYDDGFFAEDLASFGDPFYIRASDYNVTFTAPSKFVVASSGKVLNIKEEEGVNVYRYAVKKARDFALCLSADYNVKKTVIKGVEISYYYVLDQKFLETFNLIIDCFNYFNDKIGEYPYNTYAVAETFLTSGGMEYSCLSMVAFSENYDDFTQSVVHETAHQWWYGVVGSDQINCSFMDEGLAEYYTLIYFDQLSPKENYAKKKILYIAESVRGTYEALSLAYKDFDGKMIKPLNEYKGLYEYVACAYGKGLLLWTSIEECSSKEKVLKVLKDYYLKNRFKIATPNDLKKAVEKASIRAKSVYQSYVTGKVVV